MSKLLIDDHPLQVLPDLAVAIGLNEAIMLQQIHYWIKKSSHRHDDRTWIYNSATKWQKQFPFWSESTIRRTINSLKKQEMIVTTDKYNKLPMDKTLWYSINYDALNRMTRPSSQNDQTCSQNDQTILSDCIDDDVNMTRAIPETTQETNPETTKDSSSTSEHLAKVFQTYQKNIEPMPSGIVQQKLLDDVDTIGHELVLYAIEQAAVNNKRSYAYMERIMRSWRLEGINTLEAAKARSEQWERKSKNRAGGTNNGATRKQSRVSTNHEGTTKPRDYLSEEVERRIAQGGWTGVNNPEFDF